MNCIHCNHTPGEVYIHYIEGSISCYSCGFELEKVPRRLRYLGITNIQGLSLVHHYQHLTPVHCPNCHAYLTEAFYYCEEDSAVVDLTQMQKVRKRIKHGNDQPMSILITFYEPIE